MILNDISAISNFLKVGSTNNVKLLNEIVFSETFDRNTRQKLRNFSGFAPDFKLSDRKKDILKSFTLAQFITVCTFLNLDPSGTTQELCDRIFNSLSDIDLLNQKNASSIVDEDEPSAPTELSVTSLPPLPSETYDSSNIKSNVSSNDVYFLFQDLLLHMRQFSGSDVYSIYSFFRDLEDNFSLLPQLTESQKIIGVKRLLKGSAKLFIQTQQTLFTFSALKKALIDEFGESFTSLDLHKELQKRKLRPSETLFEYFLAMREIACRADFVLDEPSLIEYCINGIPDSPTNKVILYTCKTLTEFKEKLKIYEKIFQAKFRHVPSFQNSTYTSDTPRHPGKSLPHPKSKLPDFRSKTREIFCYNCSEKNHVSRNCPNLHLGPKCKICLNFGHKSYQCENKPFPQMSTSANNVSIVKFSNPHLMHKNIFVQNVPLLALVDTGADATIFHVDAYNKLGSPALNVYGGMLTAFGNSQIKPLGCFEVSIMIDNEHFITNACVVANVAMSVDLILGMDVLKQGDVRINKDGVSIRKFTVTQNTEADVHINNICVNDNLSELNIGSQATKQQIKDVQQLVTNYKPVKTKHTDIELKIQLTDSTPVFHRPRRLPFTERAIVDQQVQKWLNDGIIEPSSSDYSSPVVVVKKKDGSPRICIDFRKLNKKILKNRYPLPMIDDLLDRLQDATIFSTIDLKNAFFHVSVEKDSRRYTSFVTHNGQFHFKFAPFGLCLSPSVFQKYVNTVFKDLILQGYIFLYLDDFIIPAKNDNDALHRLKLVFSTAADYGLEINFSKCSFLTKRIEFLGHIIENGKLYPSPSKTAAVINFPEPTNHKDLQSFIGLASYFRKFILNFSIIAQPLSDLLKKNTAFHFGDEQKRAFLTLKNALCAKPVLSIYNQQSETEIHTDASIHGYGCILFQKSMSDNCLHPVYYMSKKTSDAEKKYCSYELEVLAIIQALKKFRVYLLGKHFKIITDCDAFKMTMNKRDLSTRIARWALLLEDFDYEIEHRSGIRMAHVDALSRFPVMVITHDSFLLKLKAAQEQDDEICAIKEIIKIKPYHDYCMKGDILYKFVDGTELLVVPNAMQTDIIKDAHQRGHFSSAKVITTLKQNFYIPKVKEKVDECISNCVQCILINRKSGKQDGLLNPIPKDDTPLHTYHIDHLGPLETTNKKYKYIFAVIDSFTKFSWLYPTKSTDAAEVVSKLDSQKFIFGNPARIISDRGTAFTSTIFSDYCKAENIQHILITTGLPRANGQIERLNSVIVSVLSKLTIDNPSKWYLHVPDVQQVINSTFHRSIHTTPFQLMFGTPLRFKNDLKIADLINSEIQAEFNDARNDLRNEAKQQILKVQNENRKTYNLRRRQATKFQLHDLVAIKRTQFGPGLKLKPKYLGPYKIVKIKANNTYDVQKCAFFDGPQKTSTCAEFIKPWTKAIDGIT